MSLPEGFPRDELFVGTLPLCAVRLLLSTTASSRQLGMCVMVLDMSCALRYAKVKKSLYIELPVEDEVSSGRGSGW